MSFHHLFFHIQSSISLPAHPAKPRHGQRKNLITRARYRQFRAAVEQAAAHTRMNADIAVPKTWLGSGPGKEIEGTPGCSALVKALPQCATNANILASPEWNGIWAIVLKAPATFPDARAAVADALAALNEPIEKPIRILTAAPAADPPALSNSNTQVTLAAGPCDVGASTSERLLNFIVEPRE